jgi:hypothetical protein
LRILSYTSDDGCPDDLTALINEVYGDYPDYASSRAGMVAKALAPSNPFLEHGQWRGFLAGASGGPMAHACAITDRRLPGVGFIGFFEASSDGAGAGGVLQAATRFLVSRGVKTVRGPVDLTTWNRFRVCYPDQEPPFVSEPFTRAYYRSFFSELGFAVAQRNVSTICGAEQVGFHRFAANFETLQDSGFVFEQVEPVRLPSVLPHLHDLALRCFSDTWSFVPASLDEFRYALADLSAASTDTLIHLAYTPAGAPAGCCFAALDWSRNGRRAVIKSVAAAPMERRLEIARALLYLTYGAAVAQGASQFILSTMRGDNKRVRALTPGPREIYRQYEVFGLEVEGENL